MTAEQVDHLLKLLEGMATRGQIYTITGAADWPILVVMGGVMVALIGFMWRDLRATMRDNKKMGEKNIDNIWKALRDCKTDCCTRSGPMGRG